ncbi:MAG: GH32 C-terminal domain-containing protein, partial [Candidatus Latescibacteria bacterium]|nr:GH32 C-terminal domain-containing protein [Candidatus Latescibacterota bacterium]
NIIVIFNMNPGKPTENWNQIMTLPRKLTLIGEEDLRVEPAGDVESLRRDHVHFDGMTLPANQDVVLDNVKGNAMEIVAEIDPKNAPMLEMDVLRSPNKEEVTRIMFFKDRGMRNRQLNISRSLITIDSSCSSISPDVMTRAPETASVLLEENETLQLRVFVDKSVVEVFVNGKQCVALRVYPGLEDSTGVSLRSQGRDSELISFDAWQMQNIYE